MRLIWLLINYLQINNSIDVSKGYNSDFTFALFILDALSPNANLPVQINLD